MTQDNNQIRRKRCDQALARYGNGSPDENLTDFLTDAMHWCDTSLPNFHFLLAQACRHYINEINGDQQDESRMSPRPIDDNPAAIDIDAVLAERGQIAVVWSTEDVQGVRPDLNRDKAWKVLQHCDNKHDCEYGITWQSIEDVADGLFPKSPTRQRSKP